MLLLIYGKMVYVSLGNNVAERGASGTKTNCDASQTVESQTNNSHSEFYYCSCFVWTSLEDNWMLDLSYIDKM